MELDTPYVHLRIHNALLVGTYKKGLHISLEAAKEIVQVRLQFTGGKKMPALILSQGVISMEKAAREYLASAAATEGLLASAIVAHSNFSYLLGSFFVRVNKTAMPVRLFTSSTKAENWLQQFVQ